MMEMEEVVADGGSCRLGDLGFRRLAPQTIAVVFMLPRMVASSSLLIFL
jgi:hypothetical protein